MKKTTIDTAWIQRATWTTGVLLLGLLLSSCGSSVGRINSGVEGNNEGGQTESCVAAVGFTAIGDQAGLEAIENDLSARYCVTSDITLTGSWVPLGMFTGILDGKGHSINGLMIDDTTDTVGFFKELGEGAIVKDLSFSQASVKGQVAGGVLAGVSSATIENIKITGGTIELASSTITSPNVGGLVGLSQGTIKNSYATNNVIGHNAGGLVGRNLGTITNSYAAGNASGYYYAGGLVGANEGTITNSYATSNVVGATVGGLVGFHYDGIIENSYAAGEVKGTATTTSIITGGLVGEISGTPNIISSYFDRAGTQQTEGLGKDANNQAANVIGVSAKANIDSFLGKHYDTGVNPTIEIFIDWNPAIWTFNVQEWPVLTRQIP